MTATGSNRAARGFTCVHCVAIRAANLFSRLHSHPVALLSSSRYAPLVAMEASRLYLLVYRLLSDLARDGGGQVPVRLRVLNDPHPEVEVLASMRTSRGVQMRSLRVPRHAEGSLACGFAEADGR